ncbi:MAG: CRISPR system precrRNA processing endoribonuclease RAMP protein Cas6 [Nitrososphaerota archaeon]
MGSKSVVRLAVTFSVVGSAIIPPFSAKVSRLILYRMSEVYRRLAGVRAAFKPVSVSPLFHDGRPLIKLKGDSQVLTLEDGGFYSFNCCLITGEEFGLDELVSFEQSVVGDVFGASVVLEGVRVEVRRYDSFGFEKPSAIRLDFLSPVLLQLPGFRGGKSGRYALFPVPSLLISSLVEHWNSNSDPSSYIKNPCWLSYYSNYALLEADFHLKPVTVVYDSRRLVRGLMGWVLYDMRKSRTTPSLKRILALLDYAQYVGIGKSRATGFGHVSVKCIN